MKAADNAVQGAVSLSALSVYQDRLHVLMNIVKVNMPGRVTYRTVLSAFDAPSGAFSWQQELDFPEAGSHFGTHLLAVDANRLFAGVTVDILGQKTNAAVFCLAGSDGRTLWTDIYNGTGNGADVIAQDGLKYHAGIPCYNVIIAFSTPSLYPATRSKASFDLVNGKL